MLVEMIENRENIARPAPRAPLPQSHKFVNNSDEDELLEQPVEKFGVW
jgi:hypothetical protein